MPRRLFLAATVAALAVLGCNDRDAGPTAPLAPDAGTNLTSEQTIDALLTSLFRPGDQIRSATSHFNYIKTKVRQGRYADAQARVVTLSEFTLKQLTDGKLLDPGGSAPPTRELQIAALFCELTNYARDPGTTDAVDCAGHLEDAGDAETGGGTIGFVGPAGGTVTTPDGWGGIQLPPGAVNQFVTLTIVPIAPESPGNGPLNTDLDQYPLFFDFTVFPAGLAGEGDDFAVAAIVGMCQLDVGDGPFAPPSTEVEARLQIAHNVGVEGFEILERTTAPFLDCDDLNSTDPQFPPEIDIGAVPAGADAQLATLAAAGWQRMTRVMSPVLEALLPAQAHAAVLGKCCLGGLATKLSPFGAVDPESGPVQSLDITEPEGPVSVTVPFSLTVDALGSDNEPVLDATGTVTLALGDSPDGCTLGGTLAEALDDGSAFFSNLVVDGCNEGTITIIAAFGELTEESEVIEVDPYVP